MSGDVFSLQAIDCIALALTTAETKYVGLHKNQLYDKHVDICYKKNKKSFN